MRVQRAKNYISCTKPYTDPDWLTAEYAFKSINDIADECQVAPTTIRKYMTRFSIQSRSVSDSMKLKYEVEEYAAKKLEHSRSDAHRSKQSAIAGKNAAKKSIISKRLWKDREYRANQEEHRHTDAAKARISCAVKNKWKEQEYQQKQEALGASKSVLMTAVMKQLWQDPDYRLKMVAQSQRLWRDADYRAKQLDGLQAVRQLLSMIAKDTWKFKRAKIIAAMQNAQTKESREKRSASMKEFYIRRPARRLEIAEQSKHNWQSEEYRQKILAAYERRFRRSGAEKHGTAFDYKRAEYNTDDTAKTRRVDLKCNICGHVFDRFPHNHIQYGACPHCAISCGQREIADFVDTHTPIIINDRRVLRPLELDIFAPQHNIAIEYHGLRWHSYNQRETPREKTYLQSKYYIANAASVRLLQIYDFQWDTKRHIIESMIMHLLGKSNRLNARDLTISIIEPARASAFFQATHLRGYKPSTITFGLTNRDELVMAMSLTRHADIYEIARMSTTLNCAVRGGVSRLLKHAINELHTPIFTYADLMHSTGAGYSAANMRLTSITRPGYFYYRGNTRLSRHQCQPNKLHKLLGHHDPNLSESLNMFNNGFRRVWDAGHMKFILETDPPA